MEKTNNNLAGLNDHLFDQLERLSNPELSPDELKYEIQRAKAVTEVSSQVIDIANTSINAMKLVANSDALLPELPSILSIDTEQSIEE